MAAPTIASIYPSADATGIPTNVAVYVIFDQEVDTYRLKNGGAFLEGPDQVKVLGAGLKDSEPPITSEEDFLQSASYKGFVDCDITFARVDGSGESVDYYDYGTLPNAGQLYRTKVLLTPKVPLSSLTEYTVYIVGDEDTDDDHSYGLTNRSVYDTQKGANTGTGDASFYGGYTGAARQQFFIEMTTTGAVGTAQYEWWTDLDPLHRTRTTSTAYRPLKDDVSVKFYRDQSYVDGDTFAVWCDVPEYMDGSYRFSFTTSSAAPTEITSGSTLLTGSESTTTSTGATTLTILEASPEDRSALIPITRTSLTFKFSATLDEDTVTDSTVTIEGHPADGLPDGEISYTEELTKTLSISDEILTITLDADQLYQNNIIVITLDSTIADENGNDLGADTQYFFGTTMSPFYVGPRLVQLRLGSFGNQFPEETVALAIWDASREADALAPTVFVGVSDYALARRQFVICRAAWILSSSGITGSGSVRKRLGDFDVSRSEGDREYLAKTLEQCIEQWRIAVETGGNLGPAEPMSVVKGGSFPDNPMFGRTWQVGTIPMANGRMRYASGSRWYKTFYRRIAGSDD